METKFTVDYFIKKFEAIPEEFWSEWMDGVGSDDPAFLPSSNKCTCAIGHCNPSEGTALGMKLFWNTLKISVSQVIHRQHPAYQQPTPKQRILAALYDIKKLQEPKQETPKKVYIYNFINKSATVDILLEEKRLEPSQS